MTEPKDATKAANREVVNTMPFSDRRDFEDAAEGLIAPLPDGGVVTDRRTVRSCGTCSRFAFLAADADAPDTVNPSLWRQSQLVVKGGLYEVVDRLYQVRSADLSNLTLVEGDTGLIVFDPLISVETARAAMELYFAAPAAQAGGGGRSTRTAMSTTTAACAASSRRTTCKAGKVMIIAPVGFLAGGGRRERVRRQRDEPARQLHVRQPAAARARKGQVGAGLGMTTSSGTVTLIPPTHEITETGQRMSIDGLDFEFQLAPDTEAPAEMHWYIEQLGAVCAAENCCHTLHNTYTLRGAPIRDPQAWSKYLNEPIDRWGDRADVMFGMHHWPVWGNDRVDRDADEAAATATATSTIRPCGWPTTATRRSRSPSRSSSRPSSPSTGRCRRYYGIGQPQRQGDLLASTSAGSTATRRTCTRCRPSTPARSTSSSWAGPTRCSSKAARGVRRGRLPLGRRGREPRRVRRPEQQGGARAAGRRARAARLPGRDRAVAQLLPHRRQGAPRRCPAAPDARTRRAPTRCER